MKYEYHLTFDIQFKLFLLQGIVVKIVTLKVGEKYYKKKGIVTKVENPYQAIVKMIDTNDKIRIDQAHAETVIPAIGKYSDNAQN